LSSANTESRFKRHDLVLFNKLSKLVL